MNSIKELNSPQPQLTLVLALLLVRDTPPGMSVIDRIQQLKVIRGLSPEKNATNLRPDKNPLPHDEATALPKVQGNQQEDFRGRTVSPPPTFLHKKPTKDNTREQKQDLENQAKVIEQENKDLRAWKTEHLQELDRLRLLVEYLESENQDQKQQQRKNKKRKGYREPCPDPASTAPRTIVGDLGMDPLDSLKATLLKHADALRRCRHFIEATKRASPQGEQNKSSSISLWNESVASSLKQIIGELSRWQLAPPVDPYGEQLFLFKRYLDLVRENSMESTLTVSQVTAVLEDIGDWFRNQLKQEDSCSPDSGHGGNMSILMVECLCAQSASNLNNFHSCQLSFCISSTLLQTVLTIIVEKIEREPLTRYGESDGHVQPRQRTTSTRTLAKAKTLARISKARQSLLQEHDQSVQDRRCARFISLAIRISNLKASSTHHSFGATLLEKSSFDDLVKTLQDECKRLLSRISSKVLFSVASKSSSRPLPRWLSEKLVALVAQA